MAVSACVPVPVLVLGVPVVVCLSDVILAHFDSHSESIVLS